MIIDACIAYNEIDVLSLRFAELYPVVDYFLIVESDHTFRGNKKPYYISEALSTGRWAQYLDKIRVISWEDTDDYEWEVDPHMKPWQREYAQRRLVGTALKYDNKLTPYDIVIFADADEIPKRAIIKGMDDWLLEHVTLGLTSYSYGINVESHEGSSIQVVNWAYFQELGGDAQAMRHCISSVAIDRAGWHFSSIGDANHISNKLSAYSHWEMDNSIVNDVSQIQHRMNNLEDILGHGRKFTRVDIDETFPEAIKANREYWKKYEY